MQLTITEPLHGAGGEAIRKRMDNSFSSGEQARGGLYDAAAVGVVKTIINRMDPEYDRCPVIRFCVTEEI